MKDVVAGRADLARAYHAGGDSLQAAVAHLLGFQTTPLQVDNPPRDRGTGDHEEPGVGADVEPQQTPPPATVQVSFWQPISFGVQDDAAGLQAVEDLKADARQPDDLHRHQAGPLVEYDRLASRVEVLSRLRRVPELAAAGSEVDLDRVVSKLGK